MSYNSTKACVICARTLKNSRVKYACVQKVELINILNQYEPNCAQVGCLACDRCILRARRHFNRLFI